MKKFSSFLIILIIVINLINAQKQNTIAKPTDTSSSQTQQTVIASIKSSLHDNSLRAGFEPFYFVTNLFIDDLFVPKFPKELIEDPQTFTQLLINKTVHLNKNNQYDVEWKQLIGLPFKYYPSLSGLIIATILFAIFLPLLGLGVMCRRCCCRGKFNPFDKKGDSIKRKIYASFLFLLLLIILLATIILFFTNQNSSIAVRKIPNIYKNKVAEVNNLIGKEIPTFLDKSNDQIEFFKKNASDLFDKTIIHAVNSTIDSFKISKTVIEKFNNDISIELKNISNIYSQVFKNNGSLEEKINELIKVLPEESEDRTKLKSIENVLRSIKEQYKFIEGFNFKDFSFDKLLIGLTRTLTDNSKTKFLEAMNKVIDELAVVHRKNMDQIKVMEIPRTLRYINKTSPEVEKVMSIIPRYYDYFYFIIMGISGFMLLLFILYSFGLAGMCARRTHHNYKQTCHRGVSANFLLSGVGFYFIFSWAILIVCICLYVPGIFARHGVCVPAIQMENNELFNHYKLAIKNDSMLAGVNFTRLINDCHKTNHSQDIDKVLFKTINNIILLQTNRLKFDNELKNMMNDIKIAPFQNTFIKELDLFFGNYKKIFSSQLSQTLNDSKKMLDILKDLFDKNDDEIKVVALKEIDLENFSNLIEISSKLVEKRTVIDELAVEFEAIKSKLNQANDVDMFTTQLNKTIHEFTLKEINNILLEGTKSYIKSAPSCKIVSDAYSSLVLTGCYEILDNLNTYWFTLIILVVIHLLVVAFALCQADLFRKFYAYDELMSEGDHKQGLHPTGEYEIFQTRGPNGNGPIDAYEMNGFPNGKPQNGHLIKNNTRSPPQYRVTRA